MKFIHPPKLKPRFKYKIGQIYQVNPEFTGNKYVLVTNIYDFGIRYAGDTRYGTFDYTSYFEQNLIRLSQKEQDKLKVEAL